MSTRGFVEGPDVAAILRCVGRDLDCSPRVLATIARFRTTADARAAPHDRRVPY